MKNYRPLQGSLPVPSNRTTIDTLSSDKHMTGGWGRVKTNWLGKEHKLENHQSGKKSALSTSANQLSPQRHIYTKKWRQPPKWVWLEVKQEATLHRHQPEPRTPTTKQRTYAMYQACLWWPESFNHCRLKLCLNFMCCVRETRKQHILLIKY